MSTNLETLVHFSDYKTEKISSMQVNLDNSMSLVVTTGKDTQGTSGVTITLKDSITDSTEVSGFISNDKLQGLIKVLNAMYRQASVNTSSTN